MHTSLPQHFDIQIARSVAEIGAADWDALSAGRPFQSFRWYQFGEQVMADCPALYIILRKDGTPIARTSLWLVRNEPLPIPPGWVRSVMSALLHRWPLLICRSPMANTSGLILPDEGDLRSLALQALADACLSQSRLMGSSFLVFDFLNEADACQFPFPFIAAELSDPGTIMENRWASLQEYLAAGNYKDRWSYKQAMRNAQKLGSVISRHERVPNVDEALTLITAIERKHASPPNPWMRRLLELMPMVGGTWLESRIDGRLAGCLLVMEDNGAQTATALGRREEVPHVYFQLLYTGLACAFEKNVRLLRWGSGAYDVKKRLGFAIEHNNWIAFASYRAWLTKLGKFAL